MVEPIRALVSRSKRSVGELRAFSSLKYGDYWNTSTCSPQKPNIWTSIMRTIWYTSENRDLAIQHVKTLVEISFSVLEDMYNHIKYETNIEYQITLKHNIQELQVGILKSQDGILNLQGAYYKDEDTKTELTNLISEIKTRFTKSLQDCPIETGVKYIEPQIIPPIIQKTKTAPIPIILKKKSSGTTSPVTPPKTGQLGLGSAPILPPPPAPPIGSVFDQSDSSSKKDNESESDSETH
jgi:hypothetical protein